MVDYIPILVNVVIALILCIGIALTLVGLPGNLLIVVMTVFYGWYEGFSHLTHGFLLIIVGLWLSGELIEFLSGIMGAKKEKASWKATFAAFLGALTGGILGTIILPIIGTLIGSMLGGFSASYYVEYRHGKDRTKALQVAKGVVKGQLLGIFIKLTVAIGMSVMVVYKLWF